MDDGGYFHPSKAQKWLWKGWETYWDTVEERLGKGDSLHVICNGDAVDGDHHGTTQIVNRNPNVQLDILKRCWEPVLDRFGDRLASAVVIRGTEAHVGPSGCTEESFAKWLLAQGVSIPEEDGTGNKSHWHFRGWYEDILVDATHHGRMGGRPWTKLSAVATLAAEITLEHAMVNETPPHVALRAHYHQYADSGLNYPTRVIQMPCWQIGTAFVKKVKPESLTDIGGIILEIDGDDLQIDPIKWKPERAAPRVMA